MDDHYIYDIGLWLRSVPGHRAMVDGSVKWAGSRDPGMAVWGVMVGGGEAKR